MKEHDFQYLIEMNQVTRLLPKASMLTRQRSTVDFSDSYVIKDYELVRFEEKQNSLYVGKSSGLSTMSWSGLIQCATNGTGDFSTRSQGFS